VSPGFLDIHEVMQLKRLLKILPLVALAATACSTYKKVVVKDIPLEEQKYIKDTYIGRTAWSRGVIEDLGEGGSLPRDSKVKIVDIGMQYNGSITVQTPNRKKKIVHGLELERPLTKEKIDDKMNHLFWFKDPTMRQVDYIRKWGKKTARAIMDHEVFVGMTAEAAIESWGFPVKTTVNEIAGKRTEQWVYPAGKKNNYIYIIDGKVSKWDD
jgi:hypothetical protein